jgi:hypothetical protein
VFHQRFGNGNVGNVDGQQADDSIRDKAGEKRVVDSFVKPI